MFNFIISSLAVWRISSLLVREDGPGDVFAKLRNITGVRYDEYSNSYGTNILSSALTCVWCTSIWVAGLIAILEKPVNIRIVFLRLCALSAMAIMIEEIINGKERGD